MAPQVATGPKPFHRLPFFLSRFRTFFFCCFFHSSLSHFSHLVIVHSLHTSTSETGTSTSGLCRFPLRSLWRRSSTRIACPLRPIRRTFKSCLPLRLICSST